MKIFVQFKLNFTNIYWKTYPYIVRILNHLEFRDLTHGQNDNSFHLPINSMLEKTLPIIRSIQISSIVLFWTRKSYEIRRLFYKISVLNTWNATCESIENCRFSALLGLVKFISGREIENMVWLQKYRNIWRKKTHGVFNFTEVYFCAEVGRTYFYSLTGLYLSLWTFSLDENNKHIQWGEQFPLVSN